MLRKKCCKQLLYRKCCTQDYVQKMLHNIITRNTVQKMRAPRNQVVHQVKNIYCHILPQTTVVVPLAETVALASKNPERCSEHPLGDAKGGVARFVVVQTGAVPKISRRDPA